MSSAADDIALPARRGIGRALLRDPMGVAGLVLVVTFLTMAVFAPWIAPYDPIALDVKVKFQPPSSAHWAGTDHLGRDLLSRIIWGARLALGIAITSVAIAGALGLVLGLVAGYGPRWLDSVLVLVFDSM
jgi:peptide/nickel transport system permease protein